MKIAHFADTHIRNLKYHDDYRKVFKEIKKSLAEESPDLIIHCGDLAHTGTSLSPEYFELAQEFLEVLAYETDVVIILGNHDGSLKNLSRVSRKNDQIWLEGSSRSISRTGIGRHDTTNTTLIPFSRCSGTSLCTTSSMLTG